MNQSHALTHVGSGTTALQRAADEAVRATRNEGAPVAQAPQSQVEAALGHIDAGMLDLQHTIMRIAGRLEPVLSSASVSTEGNGPQAAPASSVPLVCRVNALAAQLRHDCATLQDLERRLAL